MLLCHYSKLLQAERFIDHTGLSMLETDGPYGGYACGSVEHDHYGAEDSVQRQWESQVTDLVTHMATDTVTDLVTGIATDIVTEIATDIVTDMVIGACSARGRAWWFLRAHAPCGWSGHD